MLCCNQDVLHCRDLIVRNRAVTADSMHSEVVTGRRNLDTFREHMLALQAQQQRISALPETEDVSIFRIHQQAVNMELLPSPQRCLEEIHALLPQLAAQRYQELVEEVHGATRRLSAAPTTPAEMVSLLDFMASTEQLSLTSLCCRPVQVSAHYELIKEFDIAVPPIELAAFQMIEADLTALNDALYAAEANKEDNIVRFQKELDAEAAGLAKEVVDVRLLAQHDMVSDPDADCSRVLTFTGQLLSKAQELQQQADHIVELQRVFKIPEANFSELQDCAEEVSLKHLLWSSLDAWADFTERVAGQPLLQLDIAALEAAVAQYTRTGQRVEKGLSLNRVVPVLQEQVATWRAMLPVAAALRNPQLQERHWQKVAAVLGDGLQPTEPGFTVQTLLERQLVTVKEDLVAVSTEASQEAGLEGMLHRVQAKWEGVEFVVKPFRDLKDTWLLAGVEDVQAVLEDSLVMMGTIAASRFVAGIRAEVDKLDQALRLFSSTLEAWLECQKNWLFLESIFSASDIQRQLPAESKAFVQVDKQYRSIMRTVHGRPGALQAVTTPGWLETFTSCNESLEAIHKSLSDHLETKRLAFPRFYFLSNEELIDIISQTKNARAVQPHLQKCFDGIQSLEFGEGTTIVDIHAMVSGEGERVQLGKNLKARAPVETWLAAVESQMRMALKAAAKKALRDFHDVPQDEWITQQPAQMVLAVSSIVWCSQVEACFDQLNPEAALQELLQRCVGKLNDLCDMVGRSLSNLERRVMIALITIEVHNRDIVEGLNVASCTRQGDFEWQRQLRTYYHVEDDTLQIKQVNATFTYGYEYLGAQSRLVVTPMTDRCYMTLTGALHMHLGGAPQGPAGTGKTETTKDLGKALGMQCVVFNCGEHLDYHFMAKFLAGLAQSGAWACFDEFNRIDIEVLSVVAQQLTTIQNALRAGLSKFVFERRELRLTATCGVFITMNPGYAGRTELPDNLKALFRPVAMMIPDYALVAEVMLFSEGFMQAKALSRKMVALYRLASEQLSQQDHYDFGMRALKSVLAMAGNLRRSKLGASEELVLIWAMRDSNMPKFLSEDAVLFQAIVSDLFPQLSVPDPEHGELQAAVELSCVAAGLQPVARFVHKCLQLHETLGVRFGVMLIGPTGGGKTQCCSMLRDALCLLARQQDSTSGYQSVQTLTLNPKSISLGELFGEYNAVTNEWRDGIASVLIRGAVSDEGPGHKWVVFDGPVDAVWVENMNTVLDDNCLLCLPNGERLKLNAGTMRILFEVGDLTQASPATVSRCGMVYMPPSDLGWQPYIRTPQQVVELQPDDADFLWGLFDQYVDRGLAFVRGRCAQIMPTPELSQVASLSRLLQAVLMPARFSGILAPFTDSTKHALQNLFAFCYVWALGGTLEAASRDPFDKFVRDAFQGVANYPPGAGLVHDYYCDPDSPPAPASPCRNFALRSWEEVVPPFKYDPQQPYFQIQVPTVDTTRFSWLLQAALEVQQPVLLTGGTGVGKTALVQSVLRQQDAGGQAVPVMLNYSAQTTSAAAQQIIEGRLEKLRKNRFGAPLGKRLLLFVDDVSMPAKEVYGAQPAVELLRQLQDHGGFYDRGKLFWKEIVDVTMLAACAPPGGGRQDMSARFTRHFLVLCMPPPSETSMRLIFSSILGGHFDHQFPSTSLDLRRRLLKPMVDSSVELYLTVSQQLLPTPTKSHYLFNLRDLSRVFQGILMIRAKQCPDAKIVLTRLWTHENLRVFHDRLVDAEDRSLVKHALHSMLKARFDVTQDYEEVFDGSSILFGDWLRQEVPADARVYEQLDQDKLMTKLASSLDDFNAKQNSSLSLVFFRQFVEHVSALCRVLRQPQGNALLVGVGGSGKQTLARFAAHLSEVHCFQIQPSRGYGVSDFRDDLKKVYRLCGVEGKQVAFILTDSQIVCESFVEDVSNILNSGDVPGMFAQDEREQLISACREQISSQVAPAKTLDRLWAAFVARVRTQLHIVLCMNPVGPAFRQRCRQFPALVNCCTIDWFLDWPAEALRSVSTKMLADVDGLSAGAAVSAVAELSMQIHRDVGNMAQRFYAELRRRFYITPRSFLDLLSLYGRLMQQQQISLGADRERLVKGLTKLRQTNETVDTMQRELTALQPVLQQKTAATEQLLVQVTKEGQEAQQIRSSVAQEEAKAGLQRAETANLKDSAWHELDEVLPTLEAAQRALNALNKNDIIEIRTFTKPPVLVQLTMEGVCILLQEKPDWDTAKRVLGNPKFIERLVGYDADNIPASICEALARVVEDARFTPDQASQLLTFRLPQSNAARSMCLWVRAMDTYSKVVRVVEPKRQALQGAETALQIVEEQLAATRAQLRDVVEKVDHLKQQLADTQAELGSLQAQYSLGEKRLARASKLMAALGNEAVRWTAAAEALTARLQLLPGDVLLAAAAISYLGPLTGPYRAELLATWNKRALELGLSVSPAFNLQAALATAVEIREWNLQGLPSDSISVDNGVMVLQCQRWPLMIDPQRQANRWIRTMEGRRLGLKTFKPNNPTLMRGLESCIRLGSTVLVEDLGEEVDPALQTVLQNQIVQQGSRRFIRLAGSEVDYDPNFKLFLTTKLANPHYLPEICITTTLINFTVTREGLEAQLLAEVVRREAADLEASKDKLVLSLSADTRQLQELQARILKLLKDARGNILDDEALISTLNNSKATSGVIEKRVKEAQQTERDIDAARSRYRTVPVRGSILYFVIADLAAIDPMYQHSLAYFMQLFTHCIEASARTLDLETRLNTLLTFVTNFVFSTVCRGLFEVHRPMFSFLIATAIQRVAGTIPGESWSFLLRGAAGTGKCSCCNAYAMTHMLEPGFLSSTAVASLNTRACTWHAGQTLELRANPDPAVIPAASWARILALDAAVPACRGVARAFSLQAERWTEWMRSKDPVSGAMPALGLQQVDPFSRLCIVAAAKPHLVAAAASHYVFSQLGQQFTEPIVVELSQVLHESNSKTPITFLLSTGKPHPVLTRLGAAHGFHPGERLQVISLGQGQGPVAEAAIKAASRDGHWVCLQNCHLARSWLPTLERLVAELQNAGDDKLHPGFRLWLTCLPTQHFPVSVLQQSVKITMEPPKASTTYCKSACLTPSKLDGCPAQPEAWRSLLFAATFCHAVLLERRKFGAVGWNIKYDVSDGDLGCSLETVRGQLAETEAVPWQALQYISGEIVYGGRVTDNNDRTLLLHLVRQYFSPAVLQPRAALVPEAGYIMPAPGSSLDASLKHIRALPVQEAPAVFGLHPNANINLQLQESRHLLDAVLSVQPRMVGSTGGRSSDDLVAGLAADIQQALPALMSVEEACIPRDPFAPLPRCGCAAGQVNSLGVVLRQELDRFNQLLSTLQTTLTELQQAIKGLAVMSSALEVMYACLMNNQVPQQWAQVAYPSLLPLAAWLEDLKARVDFVGAWLRRGPPTSFWLAALFFPQGFLTAALQNHARLTSTPIDHLSYDFEVEQERDHKQIKSAPEEGIYIHGLVLDNARWDDAHSCLEDPRPGELTAALPVIHFIPLQDFSPPADYYQCPLYRTAARAGMLSTTGQSTNFVLHLSLPVAGGTDAGKWTLQGVAALCS
eukprot:jgi/Astpho2/1497/e_gw1.00026.129.1_t